MKKVNLLEYKIKVNTNEFMKAINSNKVFGITLNGQIKFEPFDNDIYIFQGRKKKPTSLMQINTQLPIAQILGDKYKVDIVNNYVEIYAGSMWERIFEINTPITDYEDSTSEGIDVFSDEKLEEIGWYASDFSISYRDIIEAFEPEDSEVDGYLVCIETKKPYNFTGFGVITDKDKAFNKAYEHVKNLISIKIKNHPYYSKDILDDDQLEAVKFFNIKL